MVLKAGDRCFISTRRHPCHGYSGKIEMKDQSGYAQVVLREVEDYRIVVRVHCNNLRVDDFPYYGQTIAQHDLGLIVGQKCGENATAYSFTDYLFTTAPGLFGLIDGYAFPTGMCFYSLFTL